MSLPSHNDQSCIRAYGEEETHLDIQEFLESDHNFLRIFLLLLLLTLEDESGRQSVSVLARQSYNTNVSGRAINLRRNDDEPPSGHSQNHPYRPVSTASIKCCAGRTSDRCKENKRRRTLQTISVVVAAFPFCPTTSFNRASSHLSIVSVEIEPVSVFVAQVRSTIRSNSGTSPMYAPREGVQE